MPAFSFDHLNPTEFENFCYDLLSELGFVNLNWRKGTGHAHSPADGGRDIECELHRVDIGGDRVIEKWFVECKHYKEGVPPDKLSGARAWAEAARPDTLLIITSNFLSNSAKESIETYKRENRPYFKIKVWEHPRLEYLVQTKSKLLRKYNLSGDFPYLSILHPVHIRCIKDMPLNSLEYFFTCMEQLDPQKRDDIFGDLYDFILQPRYREPVTGHETMASLQIDEVNYELFREKSYEIVENGFRQTALVYFFVSFVLQRSFAIADASTIDSSIDAHKFMIAYHEKQMEEGKGDQEHHLKVLTRSQDLIRRLPDQIEKNHQNYTYFCEQFLQKLFREHDQYFQEFKPEGEENKEFYDFARKWYRTKAEKERAQEQEQPLPPRKRSRKKKNEE